MSKNGKVKLYGTIDSWGENSAERFIKRLDEESAGKQVVNLHMHCCGGQVFEGNLIYNAVRKSTVPVDIYIDGIAASMGSIIMLGGRKIYMSDNAYIMVHAPSSWVDGSAAELEKAVKLLRSLEKTFVKVYQSRTGKTEEEVKQWLVGDNWFSAQEALELGLIDGIVDAIATNLEAIPSEDLKQTSAKLLYIKYTALLHENNQNNNSKLKPKMDKSTLIVNFGLTGVTAESTDAEIQLALETKMEAEKTARINAEKQIADGKKARIATMLTGALANGKITVANQKTFEAIGEAQGEEVLQTVLDSIKVTTSISSMLGDGRSQSASSSASRADWNWDKWQEEDPAGLEALSYEEINALYKAKFKTDAPK